MTCARSRRCDRRNSVCAGTHGPWLGGFALTGTLLSFGIFIFLRALITNGQPEKLHSLARARFKSAPTFWSRIIWRVSFVATCAAMRYGILALHVCAPGSGRPGRSQRELYWISLVVKMRHLLGSSEAAAATA